MKLFHIKHIVFIVLVFNILTSNQHLHAQNYTKIKGKIINAQTKEAMPFVNVVMVGKNIGTMTDYTGKYKLDTKWPGNQIQASSLGYKPQVKEVIIGKHQTINFELEPSTLQLLEVHVVSKKKRYRNKNNPAVKLIRQVIAHKKHNRLESNDYYQYNQYEKIELSLNNITEKFKNRSVFKNFQFIFNYVDTSKVNGKPYLPIFLQETASEIYYRKHPKTKKEFITGKKTIGFHDYIDDDGVSDVLDKLYQDINLYDNNITLLDKQFVSPISPIAPNIYLFHITDTVMLEDEECIELFFQPRNKADLAFKGSMFITNDGNFSLKSVNMRISKEINLNFVHDLVIEQVFKKLPDGSWIITKDELIGDFNFFKTTTGIFGKRTVHTDHYIFNQPAPDEKYEGLSSKIMAEGKDDRDSTFWETNRLAKLNKEEQGVYTMIDSVKQVPIFKTFTDIAMLLVTGHWNVGYFDIGSINTFYSWNKVEGFRLKFGGRTSEKLSKHFEAKGFVLYGFKDKKWKYSIQLRQSLNKKPLTKRPHHEISLMYQKETNFPGMETMFINEDNLLLSIKRGVADKIIYYDQFSAKYEKEWQYGITTSLTIKNINQQPGGTLEFKYADQGVQNIASSEISTTIRFAPNETYYEGVNFKKPIINTYPIFQLTYTQGLKNVFNSDFSYGKLKLNIFKRIHLSPIGYSDIELEGGKVFGKHIPFPLLYIPRANQTYSYELKSYNLMNFLEFVSDQYVSVFAEHHFNGFIFNKIPLIKHLKLRSILSFKGIYGSITNANNPTKTMGLMALPTTNGQPTTYTLEQDPYMEMSVGVGNIFKILRVDLVKRLTYLDHANVSELGVRVRLKLKF